VTNTPRGSKYETIMLMRPSIVIDVCSTIVDFRASRPVDMDEEEEEEEQRAPNDFGLLESN
jgi:hypothetical protein